METGMYRCHALKAASLRRLYFRGAKMPFQELLLSNND
jgi:hypothetical protein